MDGDTDRALSTLVEKERVSVNFLVNRALRKFIEWDVYAEKFGFLSLPASMITKMMSYLTDEEAREMGRWAGQNLVKDFLSGLFLGVGIQLVDFKIECGRLFEGDMMRIVVADEISPDSCRLWDVATQDKLDKDRFRRDLGGLVEAYTEVAKRLGIMSEGERPRGMGPVLVKG